MSGRATAAATAAPEPADSRPPSGRCVEGWEHDFVRYTSPWKPNRSSARLRFQPQLEHRHEAATREFRIRELRLTVSLSAMFYVFTSTTDPVLVPDMAFSASRCAR